MVNISDRSFSKKIIFPERIGVNEKINCRFNIFIDGGKWGKAKRGIGKLLNKTGLLKILWF